MCLFYAVTAHFTVYLLHELKVTVAFGLHTRAMTRAATWRCRKLPATTAGRCGQAGVCLGGGSAGQAQPDGLHTHRGHGERVRGRSEAAATRPGARCLGPALTLGSRAGRENRKLQCMCIVH